jgi:hypothetical protein
MATPKFITVKGSGSISEKPFYIGVVQHERTMSIQETYAYLAERLGYTATQIRATNKALAKVLKTHAGKGNISVINGVVSVRHIVKGSFESDIGPWVKGRNLIVMNAFELDPFKSALDGIAPENKTGGAAPRIDSIIEETTGVYDELKSQISIAGIDLGPDTGEEDEYVALADKDGTETKLAITYSDLLLVKATIPAGVEPGQYTLKVYTRSGFGEEFGVKVATRKVRVVSAA